ncbi:ribonuclease HII [Gracilibacillus salitolerans]|uniref:Ribonuclease HII n=1 Tax=Gracilibacillus salitolerans TaxID=2663022 RepID=A0A5Q2TI22_9BACI|nr:ribonuclease HII [Gracilibacillus salitolerans]QGH34519.1 ribonuclease HII [Gracilibacillus salitolerans]
MKEKWMINEIKQYLTEEQPTEEVLRVLYQDQRKGVQTLLKQYEKRQQEAQAQQDLFETMSQNEKKLRNKGITYIAGVDEVGRGPLAGPVVAAAVVLPGDFQLLGINDSKKLSKKKRELFYQYITKYAIDYAVGIVDADEIDQINILQASKKAMYQALRKLNQVEHVLIDAVNLKQLEMPYDSIIKGDQKSISIAAASIIAKVTRDDMMEKLHQQYPLYAFDQNSGYGTKQHLDAINGHGLTPYHRKSFLKSYS